MNKKEYIKPAMEATEFVSEVVMNAGSPNSGIDVFDDEFDSASGGQAGNARRGTWGNRWE